jgi:hypothetical protein
MKWIGARSGPMRRRYTLACNTDAHAAVAASPASSIEDIHNVSSWFFMGGGGDASETNSVEQARWLFLLCTLTAGESVRGVS